MRREREQVLDGRRGEKVQDVQRGERDDRTHVERMGRSEREGGKERREILSENGREIRWMKYVWKRRERIEKERGGNRN
jgi:hypothetical protein